MSKNTKPSEMKAFLFCSDLCFMAIYYYIKPGKVTRIEDVSSFPTVDKNIHLSSYTRQRRYFEEDSYVSSTRRRGKSYVWKKQMETNYSVL